MARGICNDPEKERQRALKISATRKAKMQANGFLNSQETRDKIGVASKGRKKSAETRKKVSDALKGRIPTNFKECLAKAHATPKASGEESVFWKGDEVGYSALHAWVRKVLGTPKECWECGTTTAGRYEWANVSGEYKREVGDWARLCVSCHRKESIAKGERKTWNKGKRTGIVPRTAFKKGCVPDNGHRFKKGQTSPNKYLEPRNCLMCDRQFQPLDASRKYCGYQCYWQSLRKPVEVQET
jgi:hypothetical protein